MCPICAPKNAASSSGRRPAPSDHRLHVGLQSAARLPALLPQCAQSLEGVALHELLLGLRGPDECVLKHSNVVVDGLRVRSTGDAFLAILGYVEGRDIVGKTRAPALDERSHATARWVTGWIMP